MQERLTIVTVCTKFTRPACCSFDHPNILAGQGTMGLEVLEQVPDIDAAIIPVGGGGLIAGCAVALKTMKPDIQIIVSFIGYLYCRFSGYHFDYFDHSKLLVF